MEVTESQLEIMRDMLEKSREESAKYRGRNYSPLDSSVDIVELILKDYGCPATLMDSHDCCVLVEWEVIEAFELLEEKGFLNLVSINGDGCPSAELMNAEDCWMAYLEMVEERRLEKERKNQSDLPLE